MIVFDIETAPNYLQINQQPEAFKDFLKRKDIGIERIPLYAPWAQVVAIVAKEYNDPEGQPFKMATGDEDELLEAFEDWLPNSSEALIGHNIKGFDIPFLMNRYLYNRMIIPKNLRTAGVKPWEIPHIDTMELIKGHGFSNTSLNDACLAIGITSPKTDISGADIATCVQNEEFDRILTYCEADVDANMAIFDALYTSFEGRLKQ